MHAEHFPPRPAPRRRKHRAVPNHSRCDRVRASAAARCRRAHHCRHARRGSCRRACRAPQQAAPSRSASSTRRAWCRRGNAGRRVARCRCARARSTHRRDRFRPAWRDRSAATSLRRLSSARRNATSGTGEVALARPRQEVGHVGVEPHVVAARPPQAERTVRALAREQPLDRILDAIVDRGVEREVRTRSPAH